jgi:hypothetical protein
VDIQIEDGDCGIALFSDGSIAVEILFCADIEGRVADLWGVHVQGPGPNRLGLSTLRGLARWVMEALDVDELRIEGAARASGAGPGRVPAPIIFRRRCHVDA